MKINLRNLFAAFLVAAVTTLSTVGCWAESSANVSAATKEQVTATLKKMFPRLTPDSVDVSPVKGIYEVQAGSNVFYLEPNSGVLFFGELWKDGKSLTAEVKNKMIAKKKDMFEAQKEKAVKVGSGAITVIEITDPDCPYCRKMHSFWEEKKDRVTRYVFFMPLTQIHPKAEAKSKWILSQKDRAKAMDDIMSGRMDSAQIPVSEAADYAVHKELTSKSGINGTPAYWINGVFVHGANVDAINKILK